jgi:imidazolonepropionase-like amidohydrolase
MHPQRQQRHQLHADELLHPPARRPGCLPRYLRSTATLLSAGERGTLYGPSAPSNVRKHLVAALLALATAVGCVSVQPNADVLVIRGVTLIDGNGGSPLTDAVVVVEGGWILAVGQRGGVAVPRGARVEDAPGYHLVPGFIDHHAHALYPTCLPTPDGRPFDWALSVASLRAQLAFGVTTARSPATPTALGVAMRDSIAIGRLLGPRLFVSGELINGVPPEAVRDSIRSQAAYGVDFVKLYAGLTPEAVRAGIEEARAHGLPVIGHLQRTAWAEAARMGIDYLTHGTSWNAEFLRPAVRARYAEAQAERGGMRARVDWMELLDPFAPEVDSIIALLAARRIPVDPTLVAYHTKFSYDAAGERPYGPRYRENPNRDVVPGARFAWEACGGFTGDWTTEDFARAEAAWPNLLALVRRYHEGGVLLTTGTDVTNPWVIPGESLHQELELLVEAGIPPADVLRIATRNGAEALGLLEESGTVEAGKRADLVLLMDDPLADISNTRRIAWVMRGGERYRPRDLD